MKRLFFLVPGIESASKIVNELRDANIEEKQIYVVGKDHHLLEEAHLHEAGLAQSSDLIPALERGAILGGSAGLLAGVLAVTFPPAGLALGGGALLGLGLFGAGFGAWASAMIGVSAGTPQLDELAQEIESGQLLMMIDVSREREEEILQLIEGHHPEARIGNYELERRSDKG
ncbi:hypothetical protein GCM10011352_22770 [Marinobacterium zhoushanense]|uniref:DUF1269 domain-containing protein n=1 Tax=Marinobacterium zhoushanense TaxID=1679163 RepID=A0ABQ1KH41_9GAMM|nr:DUF1269 domain-containing protein [Marinobacterium zhoushanense]GGB96111.1 hypothetical protein GCM10011352_22770 [Marinobacterium zhoushanense]